MRDFQEFQMNRSKAFPEVYELMRSLSTIIYDNAGIFANDFHNNPLVMGQPIQNINLPEIWQIRGGERIVNIPIVISEKFNIRGNIIKKFIHLIPETLKFSANRTYVKEGLPSYYEENSMIEIVEEKPINELNLAEFDKKKSIFEKLHDNEAVFNLSRVNATIENVSKLTLPIIVRFLLCHVCCTPVYDKFYYMIKKDAHIPICAVCVHNSSCHMLFTPVVKNSRKKTPVPTASSVKPELIKVGISKSPFTAYDVVGMIPKPANVTMENYERYKQFMNLMMNNVIQFKDVSGPILYESDSIILSRDLTPNVLLLGTKYPNAAIFIIDTR